MGRKILSDRYELGASISRGPMSEVLSARETKSGRAVVVKTLPPSLARSPEARARLDREARALQSIDSPHVCRALAYGTDDRPYLVMEALRGQTLATHLDTARRLSIEETARIAADILAGLDAAHAVGVVHRDLKPANVFLSDAGLKLLDFGLARLGTEASYLTSAGTTLGSLAYVAPEQIRDGTAATARSDLYAVGTIAFRALTGRLPFPAPSAEVLTGLKQELDVPSLSDAVGGDWPATLESWLASLVARLPEDRHPSAGGARDELLALRGRW